MHDMTIEIEIYLLAVNKYAAARQCCL